jgi:N-acetylmuramoyl-L-alanine amidase
MHYTRVLLLLVVAKILGIVVVGYALMGPAVESLSRAISGSTGRTAPNTGSRYLVGDGHPMMSIALPLSTTNILKGQTICLDPGHGGADPGAVNSAYDLYESDINLDEAYAVRALLEKAGAGVVMARAGDETLSNAERYLFCNQAKATILVSVHTNSLNDPGYNGTLTYYGKRAAEDMALAQALQDAMYPVLQPAAPDPASFIDFGARRYGATVLRRSTMPASLVEPVFLSDPNEARLLVTPIYTAPESGVFSPGCPAFACRRGQVAQAVYQGIVRYVDAVTGGGDPSFTGAEPL